MSRLSAVLLVAITLAAAGAARADDTPTHPDTAALRAALAKQRAVNLARFHEYRTKRVYPHNLYEPGMMNVWKDPDGHLCAIATLVHEGGHDDLVEQTAKAENFVKLADLTDGPLVDWVLTSGFTQEEAVMIQAPTEADMEQYEAEQRRDERRLARKLKREDARLAKGYIAVEHALAEPRIADAGLDLAVARLQAHPELVAALVGK